MSHLQGTDYVGSMVVLEDGLPRRSEYRRFRVRDVPGNDDYAAMEEVLTRRLTALLDERDPARRRRERSGRKRFAYPPQLLLLDGGKGQLGVGVRVLERLGLSDEIPVAALAKTFEEVFVPGRPDPVSIPRGSEALFLLQRVRDEAHRFAISYHRQLRGKTHDAAPPSRVSPGSVRDGAPDFCGTTAACGPCGPRSLDDLRGADLAPRGGRPRRIRPPPCCRRAAVGREAPVRARWGRRAARADAVG